MNKPAFFRLALLVAMPLIVLAGFGVISLRRDKQLVESEVRERAQLFVNDAVERWWNRLTLHDRAPVSGSNNQAEHSIRVSPNGALELPPDYPVVPFPSPSIATNLSVEQTVLWRRIELAKAENRLIEDQIADLRSFIGSPPTENLAAISQYRLASLLKQIRPQEAANEFMNLLNQYPNSMGESGLPLAPMAMMKLAEISQLKSNELRFEKQALLDQLCSNSVAHPSTLTPLILEQAADWEQLQLNSVNLTSTWKRQWELDEMRRRLYRSAQQSLVRESKMSGSRHSVIQSNLRAEDPVWPSVFWFNYVPETGSEDGHLSNSEASWLAVQHREYDNGGRVFVVYDSKQWLLAFEDLGKAEKALPSYVGVYYQIAGKTFSQLGASKMGRIVKKIFSSDILASASRVTRDGLGEFKALAVLENRPALYAHQRDRQSWFGALIALSALVSLTGLLLMRAAFQKQQRLYEMQGNFVSSVTHEMRAPIGSIRLIAENFKRGKVKDAAEQQQFFGYIVQECSRLTSMIENVLNLARIEQGRKEYEFEPTDVVKLAEDTANMMKPSASEHEVEIKLELNRIQFENLSQEVVLDGRALQQVLINLIDNAIKHSPAGTSITVGMDLLKNQEDLPQECNSQIFSKMHLWVADQGLGIPPEDHLKIFERFYRRGSELRRETVGIGIGLSIVKHIMEAHCGKVWVESEVGNGSRFICELPLSQNFDIKLLK